MFIIYMKLNENSKIVIKSLDSTHKLKKKKVKKIKNSYKLYNPINLRLKSLKNIKKQKKQRRNRKKNIKEMKYEVTKKKQYGGAPSTLNSINHELSFTLNNKDINKDSILRSEIISIMDKESEKKALMIAINYSVKEMSNISQKILTMVRNPITPAALIFHLPLPYNWADSTISKDISLQLFSYK